MNKIIRVLHTEWSNGWGGQEIRIINEMLAVREQGIEVFLACRENATIHHKALEHQIPVFILPFKGNTDFKTLFALKKLVKQYQIDIINTHSGKDTWVGGLAAKLAGAKFIRTRHLSNLIKTNRTNFINELADYIFTTGETIRKDMIRYNRINPNRIQSIPTGIDAELFDPNLYDRSTCRQQFNLQENHIAIGIVAVLRQFKRHDLFLKMAKGLINQFRDKKMVFLIAGEGPQKEKILSIVDQLGLNESVRFLGHVSNVPELLTALDVFVLSSDSKEGVPQSVMQALLMNKAVVATNSGSTEDLYNHDNFMLVDTNSEELLKEAVSRYIGNSQPINSRQFILDGFSKPVMTQKIVNVYRELVV